MTNVRDTRLRPNSAPQRNDAMCQWATKDAWLENERGRQLSSPYLWTGVVGDRLPVASATKEGFAIFDANDFEARRNGFHAEVVNASFSLRKMDRSRLPAVRACQYLSPLSASPHRRSWSGSIAGDVKQHKIIAMVCAKLLTIVCSGSRAAVAGRPMTQPVYPQLRKYLVRSGTYASCQ